MQIPGLRGMGITQLLKRSVTDFFKHDMTTYAAALAYQALFSVFPFIIFLVALLSFLHLPEFFAWVREQAQYVVPGQAMDQVDQVIDQLQQPQSGLLSVGAVTALWVASSAVRALINALNVAYGVQERRPAWKLYPLSVIYTVGLAAMIVAAVGMLLVGPRAIEWLAHQVGMEQLIVTLWAWLRVPVAFFLLIIAAAIIYWAGPNVPQEFRLITPGATIAILVWIAASLGFSYYVTNFTDYSMMYGSIGAIVVLLLYFYLSAAVLLFGAEINAVIDRHASEREHQRLAQPGTEAGVERRAAPRHV